MNRAGLSRRSEAPRGWILVFGTDESDGRRIAASLQSPAATPYRSEILTSLDRTVEAACDGRYEAVLLCDPTGDDGVAFLRERNARGCSVPVIGIVSEVFGDAVVEALRAGVDDCLSRDELHAATLRRSLCRVQEFRARIELSRAFFDTLPHGVLFQDRDGAVINVNPAAERLLGRSAAELRQGDVTNPNWSVVDGNGAPLRPEEWPSAIALRTGQPQRQVLVGVRAPEASAHTWLRMNSVSGVPGGNDDPQWVYTTITDETELRNAQADRERLIARIEPDHARLASLFETAPWFIGLLSGPGLIFESANPAFRRLMGDDHPVGRRFDEVAAELGRQGLGELLREVQVSGKSAVRREIALDMDRGNSAVERRYLDVHLQPIAKPAGGEISVLFHGVDVTDRVVANQELAALAARHETILMNIQEGVLVIDPEGRSTYANPAAQRAMGQERVGPGTHLEALLRGASQPGIDAGVSPTDLPILRAISAGQAVAPTRIHVESSDGSPAVLEATASPVLIDDAGRAGSVVVLRDMTDRHKAEQRLRDTEAHYRRLVENAPVAIYSLDPDGRFVEANDELASLLGRPLKECLGMSISDIVDPDDWSLAQVQQRNKLSGAAEVTDFKLRLVRPSGERRWVRIRSSAIRKDGKIIGSHGIALDVTEERARMRQVNLLTAALDVVEESVAVLDSEGRLLYTNTAHGRLFGPEKVGRSTPGKASGRPYPLFTRLADLFPSVPAAGSWNGRRIWQRDDGTEIPLQLVVGRLETPEGYFFLVLSRDISEELGQEKQLRRVERLASLGTLISGLAHELNNPLHAIMNFAHLLLMSSPSDEDREALQMIRSDAERAARIVSDLRLIARQSQSHADAHRQVDLNATVRHVLRLRAYTHKTHNVEVEASLAASLPRVWTDPALLEQAVVNLVVNAEDAMMDREERRLTIRTELLEDAVSLTIRDTGTGMSPEDIPRIFDPFWTTKEPGHGTGLGLSLVHSIIEESGGSVHAVSETERGSTFTVRLPLGRPKPPLGRPPSHLGPSRRLRLLIVEDDLSVRRSLVRFLSLRGHVVEEASDGAEALGLLEDADPDNGYDVILSEYHMPGMGGADLYQRLRNSAHGAARRMIFITGNVDSGTEAGRRMAGDIPIMKKPIAPEELTAALEGYAERLRDEERGVTRDSISRGGEEPG